MTRECKTIRADRRISSNRQPYGTVDSKLNHSRMTATAKIQSGRGDYDVLIRYRGPRNTWSTAEISGNQSVRADISKSRNFIPDVEVINKTDENIRVRVCLDFS
jgi:hypothetical protein